MGDGFLVPVQTQGSFFRHAGLNRPKFDGETRFDIAAVLPKADRSERDKQVGGDGMKLPYRFLMKRIDGIFAHDAVPPKAPQRSNEDSVSQGRRTEISAPDASGIDRRRDAGGGDITWARGRWGLLVRAFAGGCSSSGVALRLCVSGKIRCTQPPR
jgi:hypothetical protein